MGQLDGEVKAIDKNWAKNSILSLGADGESQHNLHKVSLGLLYSGYGPTGGAMGIPKVWLVPWRESKPHARSSYATLLGFVIRT